MGWDTTMSERLVFGIFVVSFIAVGTLFVSGVAVWTVEQRRARRTEHYGGRRTPRWLRLATIGCSLLMTLCEICRFAGRRDFTTGVSCLLWIVVSALYVAQYRIERKNEGKDR